MYGIEGAPAKRTNMWPTVLSEVLPACGGYFYRMVRAGCRFFRHGDPLDERMRQVECGKMDDQRGPPSNVIETSDISINSPGASLVALHGTIT